MINYKVSLKKNQLKYILLKKNLIFFSKSYKINKWWLNYLYIHKGNSFVKIKLCKFFQGFLLGELVFTRKLFYYPKALKKKKHLRR